MADKCFKISCTNAPKVSFIIKASNWGTGLKKFTSMFDAERKVITDTARPIRKVLNQEGVNIHIRLASEEEIRKEFK